jgi:hypothetical protein
LEERPSLPDVQAGRSEGEVVPRKGIAEEVRVESVAS